MCSPIDWRLGCTSGETGSFLLENLATLILIIIAYDNLIKQNTYKGGNICSKKFYL